MPIIQLSRENLFETIGEMLGFPVCLGSHLDCDFKLQLLLQTYLSSACGPKLFESQSLPGGFPKLGGRGGGGGTFCRMAFTIRIMIYCYIVAASFCETTTGNPNTYSFKSYTYYLMRSYYYTVGNGGYKYIMPTKWDSEDVLRWTRSSR